VAGAAQASSSSPSIGCPHLTHHVVSDVSQFGGGVVDLLKRVAHLKWQFLIDPAVPKAQVPVATKVGEQVGHLASDNADIIGGATDHNNNLVHRNMSGGTSLDLGCRLS
jgi:hypothetical protein